MSGAMPIQRESRERDRQTERQREREREGGWEKETAEGLRFGTQGSCLQCLERGILSHARNEGMSQEFRSCGLGHMFGFSA